MIRCRLISLLFSNKETGFKMCKYMCVSSNESTIKAGGSFNASGFFIPDAKGAIYTLYGKEIENKNGLMYKISSFDECIEKNKEDIVQYLSSVFNDEAIANAIYKVFGNDAVDILDKDIDRIAKVKDIPIKELSKLRNIYIERRSLIPLLSWLCNKKIDSALAKRIYENEGKSKAITRIKNDPYILYRYGISLGSCIKIASTLPLSENHTGLAQAVCLSVLRNNETSGNVAMEETKFHEAVFEKLKEYPRYVATKDMAIEKLITSKEIVILKNYVYRGISLEAENEVARNIARLLNTAPKKPNINVRKKILEVECKMGISLHENQRLAIEKALISGVSIITGGPGTGKTTVVKVLRQIYENSFNKKMVFLAPTGRAAARMKESSGYDAFTIHKKLLISDSTIMENTPKIEEDCCVCDEASMLALFVARKLLSSIISGHQIVFLGDINQLPSVGVGRILHDMIESKVIPTVMLTKVYRQSAEMSRIYINCQKIIKGNLSLEIGDDFEYIKTDDISTAANEMIKQYIAAVNEYGIDEVCCLSPFRRTTETGTNSLNAKIQAVINPEEQNKPQIKYFDKIFRLRDRVMNRRNTPEACNGDIGTITAIKSGKIEVSFPFSKVEYLYDDMEYLELAYAMSIHKSQGSEFKCCICCMLEEHRKMLQMNLFNTAVSRASEKFILISNDAAITTAINSKDGLKRTSALKNKLVILNKN